MTKSSSKKGGRPTSMTSEVVKILELQFSYGATDEESCFIAGISKQTLYNYIKKNKEFSDRKEGLKGMIRFRAKRRIAMAIEDSGEDKMTERDRVALENSWRVLEKSDDEYKPAPIGNNSGTQILINNANLDPRERLKTKTDAELLAIAERAKGK